MIEAIQEHWLGSFLLNVLGYALILVPAALLIRRWKKSPLVQRGGRATATPGDRFLSLSLPVGEGPVYSVLHQLVFGDDGSSEDALGAVEKGEVPSPATAVKSRETASEMRDWEYWWKLVVCVVGLQTSYLTWGVLQVYTTLLIAGSH